MTMNRQVSLEACHRCFEPLQRRPRTLLERLFLARVMYCATCARKTRFLHDGMLRYLGRVEWLLNIYTSCADCGYAYVSPERSARSSTESNSLWDSVKEALRPRPYNCERCGASFSDIRASRYVPEEKPASRPARAIRVADMNAEGSIDISTVVAEPALVPRVLEVTPFDAVPAVRYALPAATVATDGLAAPTVHFVPSLDVIRTLPPLDVPSEPMPAAAIDERVARAVAECERLEALLAAFEKHAKSRPRSLNGPAARPALKVLPPLGLAGHSTPRAEALAS